MKNFARIEFGVVVELFSTEGNIQEMFHPDLLWVEIGERDTPELGWMYSDGTFSEPPPPSSEKLSEIARAQVVALMELASRKIAPLQDAIDLGEALPEEEAAIKQWKAYRVDLNRLESQDGWPEEIDWPIVPYSE